MICRIRPSTQQFALYVVVFNPTQMAAGLPENYEKFPDPLSFIQVVPIDSSETRTLDDTLSGDATIASKDRNSEVCYVYRDADDADWKTHPHALRIETRKVSSQDHLQLVLAAGGGQAIRLLAGKPR